MLTWEQRSTNQVNSMVALGTSYWIRHKGRSKRGRGLAIAHDVLKNWYSGGVESNWVHSALRPPMAYCASPGRLWWWRNWWNDWQGKPQYSEKTCPSALCPPQTPHGARVRAQVRSCGICGGQCGTGAGFLRVLPFPLPILIPPTTSHSSSIIRGWYNRPISGRRTKWTQSHPTTRN
jgi:hypothetical protein